MPSARPELAGPLAATATFALVGSSFAASRRLSGYPLAPGQAVRYALAALILLAVARGRLPRIGLRDALLLGALAASGLAAFNAFVVHGAAASDPALVGVVVGTVPVVLAILGPLQRGLRPS